MRQLKYVLESEDKFHEIDEEEYRKRMISQSCMNLIKKGPSWGKNKGKKLLLEQRQIILEYFEDMLLNNKKSISTIKNYINHLYYLSIDIKKPYSLITTQDFKNHCIKFRHENMAENSINLKLIAYRLFFTWLKTKGVCKVDTSWITNTRRRKKELNEEDLLTNDEIRAMTEVGGIRDACFVMIMYEGALRLRECLTIKIGKIYWNDDETVNIIVKGKTGERRLLFIDSVPFIKKLLQQHPYKNNKKAPLFINQHTQFGRQLTLSGYLIIKKLAKRAGIKKHVHPHLLRHSRLNYLAKFYKFNERDLRKFAGWSGTSDMVDVYIHYDMDAVEDKIRGIKGKTENTLEKQRLQQEQVLKNFKCPECETVNCSTDIICSKCNKPFEEKKKELANEELNKLFADDEFKQLVKSYLKKKAIGESNETLKKKSYSKRNTKIAWT